MSPASRTQSPPGNAVHYNALMVKETTACTGATMTS